LVTGLGPMTNAVVLFSTVSTNTSLLDSEGAKYLTGNTFFDIKDFRSVGRIDIYNGGSNYKIGDEILFGLDPSGTGAAAAVKTVDGSGTILTIEIQPSRIVGTGTFFTNDLQVGDKIVIRSQERFVNEVTSSTTANVNVAFSWTDGTTYANNYKIGSFARGLVGGTNYTQNVFPTVTVSTGSGGSGANIAITSLIGDGESLDAIADGVAGSITSIRLLTGGVGYQYIPEVDLTNFGNSEAVANATLGGVYVTLPGRWITSDSIISNSERRLQGSNYYVDFSYVTSSLTEFAKYKQVLRELLHPAGFVNYADLNKQFSANTSVTIQDEVSNTISGIVDVTSGSPFILGTNTRFVLANNRGILTIGSNVAVNGEIRTIGTINSNANVSVTSSFTHSANGQTLIILT
jgi:hypothetical protein